MIFEKFTSQPYVIAEIGANHNGRMDLAKEMIREAKKIGCDCVKLQSFDQRLFAKEVYDASAFLGDGRDLETDLLAAVQEYSLTSEQIKELCHFAHGLDIQFSSSAFEHDQVLTLEEAGVDFIKVASMDVNNPHLLRKVGESGLPVVLSTGMASLDEIAIAVSVLETAGCEQLALLHCVSLYPAPDEEINLNNIGMLSDTFGYPVGFSDHTEGVAVAIAAIAKGAVIIEKHFTLDKKMEGWDHALSLDSNEMASLVDCVNRASKSLGTAKRSLSVAEKDKRKVMRRSLVAARHIPAGKVIESRDLTYRRPGTGLPPTLAEHIIGMKSAKPIEQDTLLTPEDFGQILFEKSAS
jgi:sialic acid synthase SpsE